MRMPIVIIVFFVNVVFVVLLWDYIILMSGVDRYTPLNLIGRAKIFFTLLGVIFMLSVLSGGLLKLISPSNNETSFSSDYDPIPEKVYKSSNSRRYHEDKKVKDVTKHGFNMPVGSDPVSDYGGYIVLLFIIVVLGFLMWGKVGTSEILVFLVQIFICVMLITLVTVIFNDCNCKVKRSHEQELIDEEAERVKKVHDILYK